MSEIDRIVLHYDEMLSGAAWHGDNMWQMLDGLSVAVAAARPWPSCHTIWEIVMHMIFWEEVATERLAGRRAGLVEERNFPSTPEPSEVNWQATLAQLRASNGKFREAVAALDAARLDALSAAGKRSFYAEAHGLIEHHVYHLGQIVLLQKAQS